MATAFSYADPSQDLNPFWASSSTSFQLAEFAQRSRFVREQAAKNSMNLAEGVGFEPTVRLPVRLISSVLLKKCKCFKRSRLQGSKSVGYRVGYQRESS